MAEANTPMTEEAIEVEPGAAPTDAAGIGPEAAASSQWDVLDSAGVGEPALAECPTVNNLRFELQVHEEPLTAEEPQPAAEPVLRWDVPDSARRLGIDHYVVKIINENHGKQREEMELAVHTVPLPCNHLFFEDAIVGSVCRADVTAMSEAGIGLGPSQSVRFLLEKTLEPDSSEAQKHWVACAAELQPCLEEFYQVRGRGPTLLVLGKQHHGKSSIVNHFHRWLRQWMRATDLTTVAPPGDQETTRQTERFKIPVRSGQERFVEFMDVPKRFVEFVDVPAFATMNPETRKDLQTLLRSTKSGWARGQRSWWPIANAPDGVIIVVSLLSWRDEYSALKEYLAVFTEELQHRQRQFPYVVYATHKDKFSLEEGNKGKDPRCRLEEAVEDLRRLANTRQVFPVTSYRPDSWWTPAVDKATRTSLQQLISDAKRQACKTSCRRFMSWNTFLLVLVVCLVAVVWKIYDLEQKQGEKQKLGEEQAKTNELEQKLAEEQAKRYELEEKLRKEQPKKYEFEQKLGEEQAKTYELVQKLEKEQMKAGKLQQLLETKDKEAEEGKNCWFE